MKNFKNVSTVLTAAGITLGAVSAQANMSINVGDNLTVSGGIASQDTGSGNIGYVKYGTGAAENCYAGAFSLTIKDTTSGVTANNQGSFCTDVTVFWQNTDTYKALAFAGQTGVSPAWSSDPQSIQNASYLYNTFYVGQSTSAAQDAGLQLAIWKVLYDTGSSGTIASAVDSFSTGKFTAWGFGSAAMTDAQQYVNDINLARAGLGGTNFVTYSDVWLKPTDNNSQGLIWSNDTQGGNTPPRSVPEPSTIFAGALLLLPLGVSAVRILRKNRTEA